MPAILPPSVEPVHLEVAPYRGPRSHHASRAFAEFQERLARRARRKKLAIVLVLAVLVGSLVLGGVTAVRLGLLG
ncbi:MAG: hypothetical protein U0271_00850 [Polyangiaceae bacterium]